MERIYHSLIQAHLAEYRQMVFLSGPRQSGKTTLSKACIHNDTPHLYLNWDDLQDREQILKGIDSIMAQLNLEKLTSNSNLPVIIFDEIHKHAQWKQMLKGYFDKAETQCKMIITGSAKLNIFRRTGDSMMGRYFLYRIHPLSIAEIAGRQCLDSPTTLPKKISPEQWSHLLNFGGFPEPYLNGTQTFYGRWRKLKHDQFFYEDLTKLSKLYDIARIELLANLINHQIGSTTKYSTLAKKIQVTEPTVRNWISVLENLYYCFSIKPWSKNISRSLLKEPKTYLWDWSVVHDSGAKLENLVASHLLKATHLWTDAGLGEYKLFYLRDKDQREVDFLVTKNHEPWMMVECKSSPSQRLSHSLRHFQKQLNAPHVFQVCPAMHYIDRDCFALNKPMIVPLQTLLSQLV